MKIVFFIGSMQRGGAERVISILANDYCSRGWDVDVVLLLNTSVAYPLDDRIKIINMSKKSGSYIKNAFSWLSNIKKYLRREKPHRVVSFVGRINALVLTAAMGLKLHIVVSERNDPKHDGRGRAMQWYCNKIYRKAKAVVFQNKYEQSCFDCSLDKIGHVIPNPVSVSAIHGGEFNRTVATAGRLMEQKNQGMLVEAINLVYKSYPDLKCKIYGEGHLRDALQKQIDELDLTNVVSLPGNVPDIHEKLLDCGVFVLTSEFEGLSNALIEAMMMGLPCITTDYPGADELIRDGENGIIVPRGDVNKLAEKITILLSDNELRTRLSKNARTSAEAYKKEIVLSLWQAVIGE